MNPGFKGAVTMICYKLDLCFQREEIQSDMSRNPVNNLDSILDKDVQKKAKELLKSGALLFCCLDDDGRLTAILRESAKSVFHVRVDLKGGETVSHCSCASESGLCIHAAAAIVHYFKYSSDASPKNRTADKKPVFAGIDQKEIDSLLNDGSDEFQAGITLELEAEMPHSPSRWAKCVFEVNMNFEKRSYKGSLANLRQIHFKDSLGGNMRISHFPPQDRQIIRFLSTNAEADGFKLQLSSEAAADFFHCLSGFENFYCGKEKVTVHKIPAAPVLSSLKSGDSCFLRPGIETDRGVIPLKDPRIIMGKSGCWAGLAGDYWWIPATFDLVWLRNFLHAKEQHCEKGKAEKIFAEFSRHSIKTSVLQPPSLRYRDFNPVYYAKIAKDKSLQLELKFNYAGTLVSPGEKRLAESAGIYWKRNLEREREYENEILLAGFNRKAGANGIYFLTDTEATGLFFEKILGKWIAGKRELFISPECASFIKTGSLEEFALKFVAVTENGGFYEIKYRICTGTCEIKWKTLVDAVKNGRHFIETKNGHFRKTGKNLCDFIMAVHDFVQTDPEHDDIIRISRASALFWYDTAKALLGEIPPEFTALRNRLENSTHDPENEPDIFTGTLRTYQRDGIGWIGKMSENALNSILADEMGLGKTIQALAVIASCKKKNASGCLPTLILCPSSLVENWEMEAQKFTPSLKVLVLRGPDRILLADEINKSDIVISSYALAQRDIGMYGNFSFNYLILDEAQHIKNPDTANARTCKSISSEHKLVLTGTPLENSAEELWSIFDFLHPGMLGSYRSFRLRYAGIRDDEGIQKELAVRVAPFILRRKKLDVAPELPEKLEQTVYCEMDEEQRRFYNELLEKGRDECADFIKGKKTKFDMLTCLLRLRQFCCNPALLPADFAMRNAKSAKTELMQELLLESIDSGHRLLLFSQFTSLLKIVRTWLDEKSIRYEYLDGSTTDRMDRVMNFNNSPDIPVFLLSLKAGGSGLNLTAADRVIIYDPWWNPAVEMQATDRAHRIGQDKKVCSMKLVVKDSVEEKMLTLQRKKQKMFTNLMDSTSSTLSHLSNEDIEFLLGG
jgi:superfamily II DNA or RNA helicase